MFSEELHYKSLFEIAKLLATRKLSPVELTKYMLDRIERIDPQLLSYTLPTPELALHQARLAEEQIGRRQILSQLHGVPVAVKDLCYTQGIPTMSGMPLHRDFRPGYDATVVRKLREAGAVLIGKLALTEGAFADHHPDVPPPINPWHRDHWSGASSSGSGVATAAGLCFGSLGSDTGGSIRFPSAANGVTGLKPTWGRVSRFGCFELAASLDHIGPMCRTAEDCAIMLQATAGEDVNDPTASRLPVPDYLASAERELSGFRVGIDENYATRNIDLDVSLAMNEALRVMRNLGAQIVPIRFPDVTEVVSDWGAACSVETAVAHEDTYPSRRSEYGPGLSGLLDVGRSLSAMDLQHILLRRADFRGKVIAALSVIDVMLIPAQPFASPTVSQMSTLGQVPEQLAALLRYTAPFDMSGHPTLTVPAGFTAKGLPVAVQFVGNLFDESAVIRAGRAFQFSTNWHQRHPSI